MSRRIQSLSLILALLAVPLALLTRGYACTPHECTMMCCLSHKDAHAMSMHCHSDSAGTCVMHCQSQKNPDYGLASPLPPTQLQAALAVPVQKPTQSSFSTERPRFMSGFSRIPLEPPRL